MKRIRDVLRLSAEGMSMRQISKCTGVARDTTKDYLARATAAKLTWPLAPEMNDYELEQKLFPSIQDSGRSRKPEPDYAYIHEQLKRRGSTLEVLHQEFLAEHPSGISYPLMCQRHREFKKKLATYLRKTYKAGEVVFVDFSGMTMKIYDPKNSNWKTAQIFVGVLGASNYTYAEAIWTQSVPDWIETHNNMFAFFGGVPHVVTPDNLKAAVTRPCRSEAEIQVTYQDMARHYGTVIVPARVRKPQDKAKAEAGVQFVQRSILFRLRNRIFTSLAELNNALKELLVEMNNRPFKKLKGCRRTAFEEIDKPALYRLPYSRYEYTRFQMVRVGTDYHIDIEGHHYSVPSQLCNQKVDVRITQRTVEVFHHGNRIASHAYSSDPYGSTTISDHMPPGDRAYSNWSKDADLRIAGIIGPATKTFMGTVFARCGDSHDAGYRQSTAFHKLQKDFDPEAIEGAAKNVLELGLSALCSSLRKILTNRVRTSPAEDVEEAEFDHAHIRGADYYH